MQIQVTLTGADDSVEHADLLKLGARFPQAEWAVLVSSSRKFTPRYPSGSWMWELMNECGRRIRLAAHLCGDDARRIFSGDCGWLNGWNNTFQRIQLNGYSSTRSTADLYIVRAAIENPQLKFILQVSNAAALERAIELSYVVPNVEALFDLSGGRGIPLTEYPPPPGKLRLGYAGGIGLHNLEEVLGKISAMPSMLGDTWVDMESSLRSGTAGERFDLAKCEEVLKKAEQFAAKSASKA